MSTTNSQLAERPPVIAVMGHIDHGKSTLLDYIRSTKVTESEAGGITQHLSAYVVEHENQAGEKKSITFLDTPGHEAFQKMRSRGSKAADIAILVLSAEDGVKPQTLEALTAIKESDIPYVVAITKIDLPNADVEKAKSSLLEHGVYLEGLGGDIPYAPLSAKTGEGVPELLDILLLVAEMQELTTNPQTDATGVVIEAHRDPKKGVSATVLIRDGTIKKGACIVVGTALSPLRILEDFTGKPIDNAGASIPVAVIGFNEIPPVGESFVVLPKKKEAEKYIQTLSTARLSENETIGNTDGARVLIPIVIKTDAAGSLEAIEHELRKLEDDRFALQIVATGVGSVTENDVKAASGTSNALVIGFHTPIDGAARELAERLNIATESFDIIYDLVEWLQKAVAERTPTEKTEERTGLAKVLKTFSINKHKQVLGGRVEEGKLNEKATVAILRRGEKIGTGKVDTLQQSKSPVQSVEEGLEFGTQITSKTEIAAGDELESFIIVER